MRARRPRCGCLLLLLPLPLPLRWILRTLPFSNWVSCSVSARCVYVPPAAAETLVDSVAVTVHAWWCAPPHRWAPYIRLLPADGARAAWTLSDAQLRALDDAEEARVARVMRESVHADHARLRDTIRAVLRGSGVPAGTVSAESTLAAFVWARSLVGARAMTVKGERFLVPFADFVSFAPNAAFREAHAGDYFLRHHPVTVSRWDDEGSNGETTRIFGVLADRPMAMNDKVVEDYGDTTNHMCAAAAAAACCCGCSGSGCCAAVRGGPSLLGVTCTSACVCVCIYIWHHARALISIRAQLPAAPRFRAPRKPL
jgi:hypothetical protein